MFDEQYDMIKCKINELEIKEDLKKELLDFNDKLVRFNKLSDIPNIIIDNMPQEDIEIILEYTIDIIMDYKLCDECAKYSNISRYDNYKNTVLVIDDINEFYNLYIDTYNSRNKILKFINDNNKNNNILVFISSVNIEKYLEEVDKTIFDINSCIRINSNIDYKNEYKKLVLKFKNNNIKFKLSEEEFLKIVDSIKDNESASCYFISDYIYKYGINRMILKSKDIITFDLYSDLIIENLPNKENDFKDLVGLKNIKYELNSLYSYISFIKNNNLEKNDCYLNMFFLGNPGTGKTTVARLIAEQLYKLGYIKENKIIEIVPNDLIGRYVGQTKDTTRSVLSKACGGILFIDEAYLLFNNYSTGNNPYMNEAIVELVKYLEDPQNIVIFAGYKDEMNKIYLANPGIKSRIYKEIEFSDYNNNELYKILEKDINSKGLKIDNKSKKEIVKYIDNLKKSNDFGNARSIKQLSQKMIINHSCKNLNNLVIDKNDLPEIEKINKKESRIGFGVYYGK